MQFNPDKYHRRSIRIKDFNYSESRYYYVTICTHECKELFGNICRGTISCALNDGGVAAKKFWEEIPNHYPHVGLDEFIVMPNHIHGIIILNNKIPTKRVQDIEPLQHKYQNVISGSLGSIIRGYKIGLTKWFRKNTDIEVVWQRNYYEHIIRNEKELDAARKYISDNPAKWSEDEDNPNSTNEEVIFEN